MRMLSTAMLVEDAQLFQCKVLLCTLLLSHILVLDRLLDLYNCTESSPLGLTTEGDAALRPFDTKRLCKCLSL